jgi:transcription elongation GreA/GreB family factor
MTDPVLTTEGRARLTERLERLRSEVLPSMLEAFADRRRDGETVLDYERVLAEAARLRSLLALARDVEETPDDPAVVELGDLVTLELDDGEIERFLLVDPAEAALDDLRISADSPLSRALMGRRVGAVVDVHGPGSSYRCRVLGASRPVGTGRAAGGRAPGRSPA